MKIYFKIYMLIAKLLTIAFPCMLLMAAIAMYRDGNFIGSIIGSIATIAWLPLAAITVGVIKYKGMKSTLIDLAEYEFGGSSLGEDIFLDDIKVKNFQDKLNEMKTKSPEKPLPALARQLAIQENYSAIQYFALLALAFTSLGINGGAQANNALESNIRARIEEIKRRFSTSTPTKPDDKPSSGGKYGFL